MGYYFYNREEGKVFVARNGVFLEKEFLSRRNSGSKVRLEEVRGKSSTGKSATLEVEPDVVPKPASAPEPRRSARLRGSREVMLLDSDDPATYQDAMGSTDSDSWLGAM